MKLIRNNKRLQFDISGAGKIKTTKTKMKTEKEIQDRIKSLEKGIEEAKMDRDSPLSDVDLFILESRVEIAALKWVLNKKVK